MSTRCALALGALLVACATPAPRAETATSSSTSPAPAEAPAAAPSGKPVNLPLGVFQLQGDLGALHAHAPVQFVVRTHQTDQVLERFAAIHPEMTRVEGGVRIGAGALPPEVLERHRAATFLVDWDEPAVKELSASIAPSASFDDLRDAVAKQLPTPMYGTFWTASRAATQKRGDCSEHAVLLAALARGRGIPARVVLGYALWSDAKVGFGFGHAWTELFDGTRWQRVDATQTATANIDYLIFTELEDEGPGYVMKLSGSMSLLDASAIDVVAVK